MVETDSRWDSKKRDFFNFFDFWNRVSAGLGVAGIAGMFLYFGFNTQTVLVAVTATYAFISFNQMRETRWSRKYPGTLTIRPDFEWDSDKEAHVFGLRNFGTGPAINLRGCAIIRDEEGKDAFQIWKDNDENRILKFSGQDRHLSLQEGQVLPLTTDSPHIDDCFDNLWTNDGEIKREYEGKQIEFYYTFESNTGEQYPRDWNKPVDMDLGAVIKTSDSPRTVKVEEINDKCAPSGQPLPDLDANTN